jgi:hypothetical protein
MLDDSDIDGDDEILEEAEIDSDKEDDMLSLKEELILSDIDEEIDAEIEEDSETLGEVLVDNDGD